MINKDRMFKNYVPQGHAQFATQFITNMPRATEFEQVLVWYLVLILKISEKVMWQGYPRRIFLNIERINYIVAKPIKVESDKKEDEITLETTILHFSKLMIVTIDEKQCDPQQYKAFFMAACETHPCMVTLDSCSND